MVSERRNRTTLQLNRIRHKQSLFSKKISVLARDGVALFNSGQKQNGGHIHFFVFFFGFNSLDIKRTGKYIVVNANTALKVLFHT